MHLFDPHTPYDPPEELMRSLRTEGELPEPPVRPEDLGRWESLVECISESPAGAGNLETDGTTVDRTFQLLWSQR